MPTEKDRRTKSSRRSQAALKAPPRRGNRPLLGVAETSTKSQAAAAAQSRPPIANWPKPKKAAAPRKLTDFAPSTPILLTVKPAPIDLKAAVPGGGSVEKRGTNLGESRRASAAKGLPAR